MTTNHGYSIYIIEGMYGNVSTLWVHTKIAIFWIPRCLHLIDGASPWGSSLLTRRIPFQNDALSFNNAAVLSVSCREVLLILGLLVQRKIPFQYLWSCVCNVFCQRSTLT